MEGFDFDKDFVVYDFSFAIDNIYDELFWSWDGRMNEELELSLVQLVSENEDTIPSALNRMQQMSSMMMGASGEEYLEMQKTISEDLRKALVDHSDVSIGRLHSTLHQFLQLSRMFPVPPSLVAAISSFEKAKCKGSTSLKSAVEHASKVLDDYGKFQMVDLKLQPNDPYIVHLLGLKKKLVDALEKDDLSQLWTLRSSMQMSALGSSASLNRVCVWSILSREDIKGQTPNLQAQVDVLTISLCGDLVMVGSLMQHRMGTTTPLENASLIDGLCNAGLGYCGSEGSILVGLHGHHRACLFLDQREIHHAQMLKREKECKRQLRKLKREKPGIKISFRVNSNLSESVKKSREHHVESNWVTDHMEEAWRALLGKSFFVFELWEDETLVAADFAHILQGGSVYVATRYMNRDFGHLSPGFMLALVEAKFLKDKGIVIWDLGQTDKNPMMKYKQIVTQVTSRKKFMKKFRALDKSKTEFDIPKQGIIIEDIREEHLLSVNK